MLRYQESESSRNLLLPGKAAMSTVLRKSNCAQNSHPLVSSLNHQNNATTRMCWISKIRNPVQGISMRKEYSRAFRIFPTMSRHKIPTFAGKSTMHSIFRCALCMNPCRVKA